MKYTQKTGPASSQIREILARPFPFRGRDGRKRTFGEQAPDALAALLRKGYLWKATGDLILRVLDAYEADPGLVTLPFGKHEGSRLEQVSDGSVRWLAEEFGWEDPGTILARAVAEELARRKLPRFHRARWEPEVREFLVTDDLDLHSLWGVPLGAALRNVEVGWWTVGEDLKGLPKRPFKQLCRRGVKAHKRRVERCEYLRPDEEVDRPPVLDKDDVMEDRGEFDFESVTGGGKKFRKPSGWYLRSRAERRLQQDAERQGRGSAAGEVEGWWCPVTRRVNYFFVRDVQERILYGEDEAVRRAVQGGRWECEVLDPAGVTALRGERFRTMWHKELIVREDGEKTEVLRLRGECDLPQDEETLRREKTLVGAYTKALESIDRVSAASDEQDLEDRAEAADGYCFKIAKMEGMSKNPPEHWLEKELRARYQERKEQLLRQEVSLGVARFGGLEVKEGIQRRAVRRAEDLGHARFVEAGRRLRGVDSHAAYDDTMAWLEGQVFTHQQAKEIGKECEEAFRQIDRRVGFPGGDREEGTRGANSLEVRLVRQLQAVTLSEYHARVTLPYPKGNAAQVDAAWAEAVLFASAQL